MGVRGVMGGGAPLGPCCWLLAVGPVVGAAHGRDHGDQVNLLRGCGGKVVNRVQIPEGRTWTQHSSQAA
jgi:hypothetical protein